MPITFYLVCLSIINFSMESLGIFTIFMVAMIHPIISIPFGKFGNCIHKLCFDQQVMQSSNHCTKRASRFFTFTMNVYFTFSAHCTYYLIKMLISPSQSFAHNVVGMNDSNNSLCLCSPEDEKPYCIIDDSTDFQNHSTFWQNEMTFVFFMVLPLILHIIHSLMIDYLSPPIPMIHFILVNFMHRIQSENETISRNQDIELPELPKEIITIVHEREHEHEHEHEHLQLHEFIYPDSESDPDVPPIRRVDSHQVGGRWKTISKSEWFGLAFGSIYIIAIILFPIFYN